MCSDVCILHRRLFSLVCGDVKYDVDGAGSNVLYTSLVVVLMVIVSSSALPLPSCDANPTLTQSYLCNSCH